MASGGEAERFGGTERASRSRTSLVIDQLLSRESAGAGERRTSGVEDRRSAPASSPIDTAAAEDGGVV